MLLVADTNILLSFFNEKSKARELATSSLLELFSPEFALEELKEHKEEIIEKFSLSEMQFSLIEAFLRTTVNFAGSEEYSTFLPEAIKLSPDPDDADFFALALKLGCDIWSNDKKLKEQTAVKVLSTKDLLKLLDS